MVHHLLIADINVSHFQREKDALLFFRADFGNWYQVLSTLYQEPNFLSGVLFITLKRIFSYDPPLAYLLSDVFGWVAVQPFYGQLFDGVVCPFRSPTSMTGMGGPCHQATLQKSVGGVELVVIQAAAAL